METNSDERDLKKARRILWAVLNQLGWKPSKLAFQAGLSQPTVTRFLGNPKRHTKAERGLGPVAAHKIDQALALEKVDGGVRRAFREATGAAAFTYQSFQEGASDSSAGPSLYLEMPPNILAEIGILADIHGRDSQAAAILSYLVNPDDKSILIETLRRTSNPDIRMMAAAASGHLGHALLNTGSTQLADGCFCKALDLLGDEEYDSSLHRLRSWEPWRQITGQTLKDFELWCVQMIGVTKRMIGGKRDTDEAAGRLMYVVRDARHAQHPMHVKGNALRDLAAVKVAVNPTSQEAGVHLNDSVAFLSDTEDSSMKAMSLLKRAQWHKAQGSLSAMEHDVIEGLALCPDDTGVVRANALNTVAEIYVDIEPSLAERLALEALRRSKEESHNGQLRRAKDVIHKVTRSS